MRYWQIKTLLHGISILVCFTLLLGCGGGGPARKSLKGKVTYAGEPVPMGRIMFEPDISQGNDGPQGFSSIENGFYNTNNFGKGAITGPLIVTITAFEKSEKGLPAKPLFPRYVTRVNLSEDAASLDFAIPGS